MSQVVPEHLGIFGPGSLVVMLGRTSQDIAGCPELSRNS